MPIANPAPYWPRHVYLRVQGIFRDSVSQTAVEEFSFGLRLAKGPQLGETMGGVGTYPPTIEVGMSDPFTEAQVWTYLTDVAVPAVRALIATARISSSIYVTKISANIMKDAPGPSARYENLVPIEVVPGVTSGVLALQGGGGAGQAEVHPPQIALAVSLQTAVPRGPAARGRFYLPGVVCQLDSTWRMPTSLRTTWLTALQTYLRALTVDAGLTGQTRDVWYPVVVSPGGGLQGTIRPITGVRLGRTLDTIQRRRYSLAEDYASLPLPR